MSDSRKKTIFFNDVFIDNIIVFLIIFENEFLNLCSL